MNELRKYEEQYEQILHSATTDNRKGILFGRLMTEMENAFHIPMLKDEAWDEAHPEVIALYRKVSNSRNL